jgi:hypothetical protein
MSSKTDLSRLSRARSSTSRCARPPCGSAGAHLDSETATLRVRPGNRPECTAR